MNFGIRILLLAAAGALGLAACGSHGVLTQNTVVAEANPELLKEGETLYFQCIACHTTGRNEPDLQGPNLWGIFGSKSGGRPGFPYSEAMRNADMVWSEETMDKWLEKPSEYIPGNMMAFIGLREPGDREALIAYLKSVTSGD